MDKTEVLLDKPIYVGATILDLSKLHLYKFHYEYIKANYGNKAQLMFTDTDSLTYEIETDDVYEDFKQNLELFDFSGYDRKHPNYSDANKKVVGKFKDEISGHIMTEFTGLRSKMYAFTTSLGETKKTAKGIKRNVIKNELTFDDYKDQIFNPEVYKRRVYKENTRIRSFGHESFTMTQKKAGLSGFDNKRYILDDNIHTLGHGHYRIIPELINRVINYQVINSLTVF